MPLRRLACGLALLCLPLAAEAQSLAPQTTWVNDHAQFAIQSVDAEGRLAGTYTNYGAGFGYAGRALASSREPIAIGASEVRPSRFFAGQ